MWNDSGDQRRIPSSLKSELTLRSLTSKDYPDDEPGALWNREFHYGVEGLGFAISHQRSKAPLR